MTLKQNFKLAAKQGDFVRRIPAVMGRDDGGGFTFTVPGGQGYTYVRAVQGLGTTLTMAFNRAGIANTGDLPIWLDIDSAGRMIITEARFIG